MTNDVLAVGLAVLSTVLVLDLAACARRRGRPHLAALAMASAVLVVSSWALAAGLVLGWSGGSFRALYLFAGVLAAPAAMVGMAILVVGGRAGKVTLVVLGTLAVAAATSTITTPLRDPLPAVGLPGPLFGHPGGGLVPPVLAVIGQVGGSAAVVLLALAGVARFLRRNRRVVVGGVLVGLGSVAAAASGRVLQSSVAPEVMLAWLLAATVLGWLGARLTGRDVERPMPTITLAGPSIENPERAHVEIMIGALERAGYRVICPARDIEDWGNVGYTPDEATRRTCRAIDQSGAVVVDLHHGYGIVSAGYAYAKGIPVIMAAPEGTRIARPLRGVATTEVYYRSVDDVVERLAEILPPGQAPAVDRVPEPA